MLIIFIAFSMSIFAQTTTMKVMKNGVVVAQLEVSEIEKFVFQDPSGSAPALSNDALIVNKNNGFPADSTLLDNIEQLTFSDGNLSVELVGGSNDVYSFEDIAKLTFGHITTPTGTGNPQAQSPEVIVSVDLEGNMKVECAAEIKSLTLFTIDGKTVSTVTVETRHATSLPQRLSAGVYLLSVETGQGTVIKKIVKN